MHDSSDFKDFIDMAKAHRCVLKSLINKDGVYLSTDATEINNAFGRQINSMKMMLEYYKLIKEMPTRAELFLPEAS